MWNFESFTYQLGDALEKVRKEVESFGNYEEEAPATPTSADLRKKTKGEGVDSRAIYPGQRKQQEPLVEISAEHGKDVDRKGMETSAGGSSLSADHADSGVITETDSVTVSLTIVEGTGRMHGEQEDVIRIAFLDPSGERIGDTRAGAENTEDVQSNQQVMEYAKQDRKNEAAAGDGVSNLLLIREQQLQVQSQKLLQLQERNEVLERSALAVSQQDHEAMKQRYEERLQNAESRIYSISKERDTLLRGSAEESDKETIIKEKDEIIEEIMSEGQRLSKKQLDLENSIRKKAARVKELESENERLKEKLVAELSTSEQLSVEKQQLTQTLQETEGHQRQQLEIQRMQFENLLKDTSAAQAQADQAAKEAAKEGLLKRVQEAEDKNRTLTFHVEALHVDIEDQRKKAESAELRLKQEMVSLENRCHEAETQHAELLVKFPEATKPMLHQLESLQADMESKTEAWALAERSLLEQLDIAEEAVQAAEAKEQHALNRIHELTEGRAALEVKIRNLTKELSAAGQECEALGEKLSDQENRVRDLEELLTKRSAENEALKSSQQQVLEKLQGELSTERAAKLSSEMDLRQLQIEHQKLTADLEDMAKTAATSNKLPKSGSLVDEISVISEATDRDVDAVSTKSFVTSKQHQMERLQKQVQSLETTRDHLSGELVAVTQRALRAEASLSDFDKFKQEREELQARYASAIELLGEREEQVEEVKADLEDFKQMYREQIAYVAEQLSGTKS